MVPKLNTFYVPWADLSEWTTVKDQMFSENIHDLIKAYETILMWKLKYQSVPAYIECTYSLLQVMVKEYKMHENDDCVPLYNEHDLRLSYSTALIRFVNHVSSLSSYKGESLYLAAKTQNIPDWIINMRHDAAHGQGLPTLDALYIAAELSLKWLLENYWSDPNNLIDKSSEPQQANLNSTQSLEAELNAKHFFNKAFEVLELCYAGKRVEYIREMKREFFLHLEEMVNLYNLYYVDIPSEEYIRFLDMVKNYNDSEGNRELNFECNLKVKEFEKQLLKIFKTLIESSYHIKQSLIVSLLETSFLTENVKPLKWKFTIHLIQEVNLFSELLHVLFNMAGNGHTVAANWLKILLPSLKTLKKHWALFRTLAKEKNNYKTKDLKREIRKTHKPKNLIIELAIVKPPTITLDMMESVLLNPENLGLDEIKQYLKLVKPPLIEPTLNLMEDLITMQKSNKNTETVVKEDEDRIFTVEDLLQMEVHEIDNTKEEADSSNGWTKSSIDIHTWSKYPLGLLPFQKKVDCTLPNDLTWKRQSACKKRPSMPLLKHSIDMKRRKETNLNTSIIFENENLEQSI